ncbi:MAG: gliding motility lipoprotein GldH, partial [Chryseobacterium sp.]|nr:gliding motility lipoprotein GldH [Chryseobacterium sp.]
MLRIFANLVLLLSLFSCQNSDDKILTKDIDSKWNKKDVQKFDFDVTDAQNQKNIIFIVRNNNDYPYSNLRLIASIEHNKKTISTDTLNYVLAKPNGEWIGSGFGDTKEILFQYK